MEPFVSRTIRNRVPSVLNKLARTRQNNSKNQAGQLRKPWGIERSIGEKFPSTLKIPGRLVKTCNGLLTTIIDASMSCRCLIH